jgi:hypothetical protein
VKLTSNKTEREVIPFAIYVLELTSPIEEAAKPPEWIANPPPDKPLPDPLQWRWKFKVISRDDGATDYEGTELWGYTERTIGISKAGVPYKARAWANALLGYEMPADQDELDDEELVGKRCLGKVDDKKRNGEPGNKIIGLDPLDAAPDPIVGNRSKSKNGLVAVPAPASLTPKSEFMAVWNELVSRDWKPKDLIKECKEAVPDFALFDKVTGPEQEAVIARLKELLIQTLGSSEDGADIPW